MSDLKEIVIGRVYASGAQFYRTIGWLGANSLVFEEVTMHSKWNGFNEHFYARRVKGRRVYQSTLNDFSERYKHPTRQELLKMFEDRE